MGNMEEMLFLLLLIVVCLAMGWRGMAKGLVIVFILIPIGLVVLAGILLGVSH